MDTGSFFGKLFDFSFREFIALKIVKYIYIGGAILTALIAMGMIIKGFKYLQYDIGQGFGEILMAPVMFFFSVLFLRLLLEAIVALFRVAENTSRLVELKEKI